MSITNFICTRAADRTFTEILSAIGGYALLQQALGVAPSFLCRGEEGELIMRFEGCEQANKVKVELTGIDSSYSMTFYRSSFALVGRGC